MTATLKESAKSYFESFSLTSKQLNQLESLERQYAFQSTNAGQMRRWLWPLAVMVVGVLLIVYFKPLPDDELNPAGIASEIAYNHNKTLSLEFKGQSIPEISPHFSKLDFKLVPSTHNKIPKLKLVGGRYCSINKQLAAQLRLIETGNLEPLSWYQVPLPANQKGLNQEVEVYSNGVKVIMWTEKGVLHGLAGRK
jgi:hypothetical protein